MLNWKNTISRQSGNQFLSNNEFESLLKSVNLLRVSDIRYIVHKFSIPYKGTKTKLINILNSIFKSLRYDKILVDMYHEINNILFNKSLEAPKKLEITSSFNPIFKSATNPLLEQSDPPFILGPISVSPGKSSGTFNFMCSNTDKLININFLFPGGISRQFGMIGDCNGFTFEVSFDDPYPQPIDITDFLYSDSKINQLNITQINTSIPMIICVREYDYFGIQKLMDRIVGRPTSIDEDFEVSSIFCQHSKSFSLSNFLSKSLGTGDWSCPVCGHLIDPFCLTLMNPDFKQRNDC